MCAIYSSPYKIMKKIITLALIAAIVMTNTSAGNYFLPANLYEDIIILVMSFFILILFIQEYIIYINTEFNAKERSHENTDC